MLRRRFAMLCLSVLAPMILCFDTAAARCAEPGWMPVVVARGELRQQIQSMPIEQRPYRPLHFYGNTIRRQHYHGTLLPLPRTLPRSGALNLGR